MELKKSEEANIDRLRTPIVFIGLLFVGSLVLASFSYTSPIVDEDSKKSADTGVNIKFEEQEVKEPEKPETIETPAVEAPQIPEEEIKIIPDTEKEPTPDIPLPVDLPIEDKTEVAPIEAEIIDFPDVEASFPGGPAALQKYIVENVQYPEMAKENNEQGRVFVSFVVEPNGDISNIVVERGVSDDLDREAKRVVRGMPKWTAGEAKGKKVRARCRLPIVFKIEG